MSERVEVGLYEFKDKDGKNPWPYYKLMRKHNWTREYVEEVGEKNGIKISEEHYNEEEMKKKVPKKGKTKGRPKKEEKELELESKEEDNKECEIKEVLVEIEEELKAEEAIEEEEEEEEIVERFEYEGVTYLRSKCSGLIYNQDNLEDPVVVGKWDRVRERIDFEYVEDESLEE